MKKVIALTLFSFALMGLSNSAFSKVNAGVKAPPVETGCGFITPGPGIC